VLSIRVGAGSSGTSLLVQAAVTSVTAMGENLRDG
jgi:hypothetical protein